MINNNSNLLSVKIQNINSAIPTVKKSNTLYETLSIFYQDHTELVAATNEDGVVEGVITKNILYRAILDSIPLDTKIENHIKKDVIKISPNDNILDVRSKVVQKKVSNAVVTDDDSKYIGILSRIGMLSGLQRLYKSYNVELETLINNVNNGIVKISQDDEIVFINNPACRMLNIKPENVINKKYDILFYKLSYDDWHKITLHNKKIFIKFVPLIYSDNSKATLAMLYDSTEFDQIAEELLVVKELKESFQTILNTIDDGIIVADNNRIITYCNDSIKDFLNVSHEEIIGSPAEKFIKFKNFSKESNIITTQINKKNCLITTYKIEENQGTVVKIIYKDLSEIKNSLYKIESLEKELNYYKGKLSQIESETFGLNNIITMNEDMLNLKKYVKQACKTKASILLLGESGTGKEVFAKSIHYESGRKGKFVKVNCAAIPENLLETEFFGYSDGAFTGAKKSGKIGKFQLADNGTLFLDEIGDMSISLQSKLLRVLQDQEVEPIGGNSTIKVNVRIISATNKNLEQLIRDGAFREDLYYRLNVIPINIPPLRYRKDDLLPLANYLIDKYNKELGTIVSDISLEVESMLKSYDWPGNVRELENIVERIMSLNVIDNILPEHLMPHLKKTTVEIKSYDNTIEPKQHLDNSVRYDFAYRKEANEKAQIISALEETFGNRGKAAKLLGISRTTLYIKLSKYNINF